MAAEAQHHFEQALHIARLIDDQQSRREAHNLLGHLFSDLAQHANAAEQYDQALQLAIELDSRGHVIESQVGLAATALSTGEAERARRLLNEVLDEIDGPTLAQAEDQLRVYWSAYRILRVCEDEQANSMLEAAANHIAQRADSISDPALRQSYLHDIPMHHEIVAECRQQPAIGQQLTASM